MSYLQPRPLLPAFSASPSQSVLKQKACVPCRTRKVKCDRRFPCNNCVSWRAECVYPSPVRHCHRPIKNAKPRADKTKSALDLNRQTVLEDRLKSLEESIGRLSIIVGCGVPSVPGPVEPSPNQSSNDSDPAEIDAIIRLQRGVDDITSRLFPAVPTHKSSDLELDRSLLVSPSQSFQYQTNLDGLLLTEAQTKPVWRQFRNIADQQVKLVHLPQAELCIQKACTSKVSLTLTEAALTFAIYFAALISMSNDEIEATLGICRSTAISAYKHAAEQAVLQANSLSNQDLMTLQAMTILAAFSRYVKDDQKAWPLTGMARRLTSSSSTRMVTPFEIEMRRRIWWQLWYLDYRATINDGEEADLGINSRRPQLPVNVLDKDLDPSMMSIHPSQDSWTPMLFSLKNFVIGKAALNTDGTASWSQKREIVVNCNRTVQSAYLRHCTDNEPIHWLARHVAHVHFTELRMKLHKQYKDQPITKKTMPLDRNQLVLDVTDILNIPSRLEKEPQAQKWKWTFTSFPHFTHLSFLLDEIAQLQLLPPPSYLWNVAEHAFFRAETVMPATMKNGQILRLSKRKAEENLKLSLEWQRAADDVENSQQFHIADVEFVSDFDVSDDVATH